MAHNYDLGTRAWQPDSIEGWVASEVVSKEVQGEKVKLAFQLDNGEVRLLDFEPTFPFRRLLTSGEKDETHRDKRGCSAGRQQPLSTSAHESCCSGGKRRSHELVTSE